MCITKPRCSTEATFGFLFLATTRILTHLMGKLITNRIVNNNPYVHSTLYTFMICLLLLIPTKNKYKSKAAEAAIQRINNWAAAEG